MELAGGFDPDVAGVLALDAVQEVDLGVRDAARVLELAHDGDDVGWVAEALDERADELAEAKGVSETTRLRALSKNIPWLVLEDLRRAGRAV